MAYVLLGRVAETSTSTGTGAFTLAGAYQAPGETAVSYRRFSSVMSVSDTCNYTIVADNGAWERGLGTYTSTNTLTRTTVLQSSNANAVVSFATGNKVVFMDQPEVAIYGTQSYGGASGAESVKIVNVASAVNRIEAYGAATGVKPYLQAAGADTNVGLAFKTQAAAGFDFIANSAQQLAIGSTASAVNYLSFFGNTTGNSAVVLATGSDSNISISWETKGTGSHIFATNTSVTQFAIAHTASAVNYIQAVGQTTGNAPGMAAVGSDTNIQINLSSKGTGSVGILTNNYAQTQFLVTHTASAVNYVSATGAATLASAALSAGGSDANQNLAIQGKGTGGVLLYANGGIAANTSNPGSAVNYVTLSGSATTTAVTIGPSGTDANISATHFSKGTGAVVLATNSTVTQVQVNHTASAVNYVTLTGSATGSGVTVGSAGTDANVPFYILPKGIAGFGYPSGQSVGGTVTQGTSRTTAVTLNKACGQITLFSTTLAALGSTSFTLNNSCIAAGDMLVLNHVSGGTAGTYYFNAQCGAGTATITVSNLKNSITATEAPVVAFAVIKATTT